MSKSKLRKEYEAVFGVVKDSLRLYDTKGNRIYCEDSEGYWCKYEYDDDNNKTYYEHSEGQWRKREFDTHGNRIYDENSEGYWVKREFDTNNNEMYYEDSRGVIRSNRTCNGKVFIDDQSGKKFKLTEIK
jgi:hypothetical protein